MDKRVCHSAIAGNDRRCDWPRTFPGRLSFTGSATEILAKEPRERFGSMAEVSAALAGLLEQSSDATKQSAAASPWEQQAEVRAGDTMPAVGVDWYAATEFCRRLSVKTGSVWRLPSEAEWEYACRAGAETTWHFGDKVEELVNYAWFDSNASLAREAWSHETGRLRPNAFGLHDMHGNVFEWCRDVLVDPRFDGTAADQRLIRGGSCYTAPVECRSASRYVVQNGTVWTETGFRAALSVDAVRKLLSPIQDAEPR